MTTAAFADDTPITRTEPPAAVPAFIFKDDAGATHILNPQENKLTALHFWATWCVPCVAEISEIDAAQKAYGSKGLKIIALSLDGDSNMPKVKKFFVEHQIQSLSPYLDVGTNAFKASKAEGLPTTVFIDAKGNEIARAEGGLDWNKKETTDFIESHLK